MAEPPKKVVPVSVAPDDISRLIQTERSIQHWAIELAAIDYRQQQVRTTLAALYESKNDLMNKALASAGVSPTSILEIAVEPEFGLSVTVRDD